jgi:hypothetical protein
LAVFTEQLIGFRRLPVPDDRCCCFDALIAENESANLDHEREWIE